MKKTPFWQKKRKTLPGKLDQSRAVVVKKFQQQRAAARVANAPQPDICRVRHQMQLAELEALKAGQPRPKFPFRAEAVAAIHMQRQGDPGIWFRLQNGKVFSSAGEPKASDPAGYGDA